MQLLLTEDQHVIQALSPNAPQKAFTDRIGSRRVIGYGEHLDAARCCNTSETGFKLALMIAHEILQRVSIGSCLPQVLCGPRVSRSARHPDMDDFSRLQFNDEKRKERTKEEIGDLEKIAGPHIGSVIMEGRSPTSARLDEADERASCISESCVCTRAYQVSVTRLGYVQLPESIVPRHLFDQGDRL
jgi:hypothetical protein